MPKIAHAYAIVPEPGKIGRYRSVHLTGVTADQLEDLEPSRRSEPLSTALMRCIEAMNIRVRRRLW